MGRQAYITRLALGRSAFEPTSVTHGDGERGPIEGHGRLPLPTSTERRRSRYRVRQQYDARGQPINPISRMLGRRSRRAQNDVLSTVGVCVATKYSTTAEEEDAEHQSSFQSKREQIEAVKLENELGLILKTVDLGVLFAATWWLTGLRYRLQIFPPPSLSSFKELLRTTSREKNMLFLLFAGLPAHGLYMILDVGKDLLLSFLHRWAFTSFIWDEESRRKRMWKYNFLLFVEEVLNQACFILLSPLQIFKAQQFVRLVPARSFFPSVEYMIPFSSASSIQLPITKDRLSLQSTETTLRNILGSPLLLLWVFSNMKVFIATNLFEKIRSAFPRPDRADRISVRAAKEDFLDDEAIPGIDAAMFNGMGSYEIRTETGSWHTFREVTDFLGSFFNRSLADRFGTFAFRVFSSVNRSDSQDHGSEVRESGASDELEILLSGVRAPAQPTAPAGDGTQDNDPTLSFTSHVLDLDPGSSSDTGSASHSADGSSNAGGDENRPPGIQLSNRRQDGADIMTMEVEILGVPPTIPSRNGSAAQETQSDRRESHDETREQNEPGEDQAAPPPPPVQRFQASATDAFGRNSDEDSDDTDSSDDEDSLEPKHRLTCLSSFPVDSAALHVSSFLSHWLIMPLETAYLRSVADSYFASAAAAAAAGGGAFAVASYTPLDWRHLTTQTTSRVMLGLGACAGLELAVNFALYEIGYIGVMGWGKRRFGWGKL